MNDDWMKYSSKQVMDWLLEKDDENSPVRYLVKRDLLDLDQADNDLTIARSEMMKHGPIPVILSRQQEDGHWDRGDSIYYNKYKGTIWQVIMLAQMGADGSNELVRKGCDYLFDHGIGDHGGFSMNGRQSGVAHCIQGNMAASLLDLDYGGDSCLKKAVEWMACSVTGEGKIKYLRSGVSGPGFLCSSNNHEPCAWGAVKVALALSKIPVEERSSEINRAKDQCVDFLIGVDPSTAEYPHPYGKNPSTSWFKFGFPVFYITDILQVFDALVSLGLKGDQRLVRTVQLILDKRDEDQRWSMEYTYNGKTWVDIEEKGKPSKWVTYRALKALKKYFA